MEPYVAAPDQDLKTLLREYERALILGALASSRGHQRQAAASLGILPTTLLEKMKRLGIPGRRQQQSGTFSPRHELRRVG